MQLAWIDYLLIIIYFTFVLGIGFVLKRHARTSTDFFLSGRSIPAWITGLAFISANLGAQEVIGMGASGAKYGIATSHFYWIGAIPAMIFVGIFMMPFYYGSRARSVPEYLKLRFDEKTRGLNAISFAAMTVFSSGVSMYAMGKLLQLLLGWDFTLSVLLSAAVVLIYTYLGGLTSAIYNEVLQFFLIVAGFVPLVVIGLIDVGGWDGLSARLAIESVSRGFDPGAMTESWQHMGSPASNPDGRRVVRAGDGSGLRAVVRVLVHGLPGRAAGHGRRLDERGAAHAAHRRSAEDALPGAGDPAGHDRHRRRATQRHRLRRQRRGTEGVAPSQIAGSQGAAQVRAAVRPQGLIPPKLDEAGQPVVGTDGRVALDYDLAIPMMLQHYFPAGMLGLGLCALMASFMSGMAGNTTAFNTVWTYDIYQSYIKPNASDAHYLAMGRAATVFGIAISVAAAFVARQFNNIMDLLQLVFAFVNAPLFATFMLGMFWKRATGHGAFIGLLSGTLAAAIHHGLTLPVGAAVGFKGGFIGSVVHTYPSEMAQNFWTAIFAWTTCLLVTIFVSLFTEPRRDAELTGLVYSLTPVPQDRGLPWHKRPGPLAIGVGAATIVLNLIFW